MAWMAVLLLALVRPQTARAEDLARVAPVEVRGALQVLSEVESTRPLLAALESNGVRIQFSQTPAGIFARYSVAKRTIDVDQKWVGAQSETLAAVLAHESVHAVDAVNGYLSAGGSSACLDSEVRAFRASAQLWVTLYGPTGKADAADELDRQMNLIAVRQSQDPGGLETLVRQVYTDQCNPAVVVASAT